MSNIYNVTVMADDLGNVIGLSKNNPEYGYIRVEQSANQISEGGWLKLVKRSTLIKGKLEDLQEINYQKGDTITGRIIVKESLEPFNPVNPEKNLKIAGDSGIVCSVDGNPIYRDTIFTLDPYAEDEFITHDNGDEIREYNSKMKEENSFANLLKEKKELAGANL